MVVPKHLRKQCSSACGPCLQVSLGRGAFMMCGDLPGRQFMGQQEPLQGRSVQGWAGTWMGQDWLPGFKERTSPRRRP